jgi:hypothetical protein
VWHVDVERSQLAVSRRWGALSSVVRVVGRDPVSQHRHVRKSGEEGARGWAGEITTVIGGRWHYV